jgi:hypothetical protein
LACFKQFQPKARERSSLFVEAVAEQQMPTAQGLQSYLVCLFVALWWLCGKK